MEKVAEFEAHTDYIRYLEVHPSLPHVLSCSDDTTIKLWDWEKDWNCTKVFEGHAHYVMMVRFNPKDANTFASASLDRTVKVWGLGASDPHFSLDGHDKGINCVDYYPGGDKPYLLSGSDDRTVKVWDYQTKACVQTLEGHTNNVVAVCFHPRLPVLLSGAEDGTVRLFNSATYRAETTLNYGLERVWTLSATQSTSEVAIGFDEGTIVVKLGSDEPVASLDTHTSKVVWSQGGTISQASLKGLDPEEAQDGEKIQVAAREMGSTEVYPQSLRHNCNGRFVVVIGDGEYIIYTSQALRNKAFGTALDFVWSSVGTGDYAVRESISRVKTFRNFKEHRTLKPAVASAEGICGGALLGVRGPDCVLFFDWDDAALIRQIDVAVKEVYWNEAGDHLALVAEDAYYILRYDRDLVVAALSANAVPADGVEGAFELLHQIEDKVGTAHWVGDCFLYTANGSRLNYYVGGQVMTLAHLAAPAYLLGYLPKEDRVFLGDKQGGFLSYQVNQAVLRYQTAIVRRDFAAANALLAEGRVPAAEYGAVARFLESQGFKEEALQVTPDPDQKFDLSIELGRADLALELLEAAGDADQGTTEYATKWKRLGDLALGKGDLALAQRCALASDDLSGLLLLCTSAGDLQGLAALAEKARALGRANVAFLALFLQGRVEECLDLLVEGKRHAEAAFLARTYLPSHVPRLVALWKEAVAPQSEKAAAALACPAEFPNLFEDFDVALQVEQLFLQNREQRFPASTWPEAKGQLDLDLIAFLKGQGGGGGGGGTAPPPAEETAPPAPAAAEVNAPPPPGEGAAEEAQRPAEEQRAAEAAAAAAAAEAAAAAAEAAAAEQAVAAAAATQAAEAQRLAEEQAAKQAAAEAERLAAEQRAAQEAAAAEAERLAAEQRAAQEAVAAAEAQRLAAEQRAAQEAAAAAEAQRLAEEQAAAAEAARLAAEQRAAQEAAAAAEAQRLAEEQAAAAAAAEAERLAAEEAAAAQRLADEEAARKKAEEEAASIAKEADDILDDDFGDDW